MSEHLDKNNNDKSFPMKPQRVLADVKKVLGNDDIILSDVGAHKMWVAREYNCTNPNTCLISNGFCTMGFALPGSIGAKMAFPDKKVLSINGDAGFLMNVQDLETAVRNEINVVAVVWLDGEYGLIKWKQQVQFEGNHSDLKFANPNFYDLARSFNMWGKQIESAEQLIPALNEAFKQKGPAIIGVPVDYSENMKLTQHLGKFQQLSNENFFLTIFCLISNLADARKVCKPPIIKSEKEIFEKLKFVTRVINFFFFLTSN